MVKYDIQSNIGSFNMMPNKSSIYFAKYVYNKWSNIMPEKRAKHKAVRSSMVPKKIQVYSYGQKTELEHFLESKIWVWHYIWSKL